MFHELYLIKHFKENVSKFPLDHFVILVNFHGLGLVGVLKIYDLMHVQILSGNQTFLKKGSMCVMNKFKHRKLRVGCYLGSTKYSCTLNPSTIEQSERVILTLENNSEWVNKPLKNKTGKIIYKNLEALVTDISRTRTTHTDFETYLDAEFNEVNDLYIELQEPYELIQLGSVTVHSEVTIKKERE